MFINSFINDPSRGLWSCPRRQASWAVSAELPVPAGFRRSKKRSVHEKNNSHALVWDDLPSVVALLQFDVETERTQLFDQHVEGFGDPGLKIVIASDNRLVDFGPAGHVVRLDRPHLLQ